MKKVLVLGASGSIGKNTIEIIRAFPDRFSLAGFTVGKNLAAAEALKKEFPEAACFIASEQKLETELYPFIVRCNADIAVNGISGAIGLRASICCIEAKLDLALANKESIVMAGGLLKDFARRNGVKLIPVDSEHSAVFCLINAFEKTNVDKIILTASGGPFRKMPAADLQNVTVADALNHPTWKMGGKISIDSATLANKALEVIEAVNLFDLPAENVLVSVHPESIIHSMILLNSGEVYAQASPPDMRFPILQALEFPQPAPPYLKPLDFSQSCSLHFEPPRFDDFPLLKMGFDVAKLGASYPIAFNAANEVAVEKFLSGSIGFLDIARVVSEVLSHDWHDAPSDFAQVFDVDANARHLAASHILGIAKN